MRRRVRNLLCGHGEQGGDSKRDSSRHCVGVQPEAHLAVGFQMSKPFSKIEAECLPRRL